MTDYSQFDDDNEITDLFDDFANANLEVQAWYESEDVFELKACQRELADI